MAIDDNEVDIKIPSVTKSEQDMRADAPTALTVLERLNQLDLADMLGLSPYLKEAT